MECNGFGGREEEGKGEKNEVKKGEVSNLNTYLNVKDKDEFSHSWTGWGRQYR